MASLTGSTLDILRTQLGAEEVEDALNTLMLESVDSLHLYEQFLEELSYHNGDLSRVVGLTHKPVDVDTFIDSDEFLNISKAIYPEVRRTAKEVIEGGFIQFLAMGAIGRGKTTTAQIVTAYHLYLISLEKYPQVRYGLMPTSTIWFAMMNKTADLARDVTYGEFYQLMEPVPYFREHFPFDRGAKSVMQFPRNIRVRYAAAYNDKLLGQNIIGGIVDEMNFMNRIEKSRLSVNGGEFNQAKKVFGGINRRRKSRFLKLGKLPGCISVVSSAGYPGDFTDELKAEVIAAKDTQADPGGLTYVWDGPQWDVVPADRFVLPRFLLEVGDERHQSRILKVKTEARSGAEVIDVPGEYRKDFEDNMSDSLRDIAGRNIAADRPYFWDRNRVWSMADRNKEFGYVSPFTADTTDLSRGLPELNEGWKTIPYPQRKRAMHIDLATTGDMCGVAMGYVHKVDFVRSREDGTSSKPLIEEVPFIRFDFTLGITAPKNGEIDFAEVREFVYWVRDELGYPLQYVSFDGFQSVDSRQILKKVGFTSEVISVEGIDAYQALRTACFQGRLDAPENAVAFNELCRLKEDKKYRRVDHPQNGSKDIADGMAGVYMNLVQRRESWVAAMPQGPRPIRDERGTIVGAGALRRPTVRRNIERR